MQDLNLKEVVENEYAKSAAQFEVDVVGRAEEFARHAHAWQTRENGEPYIIHPKAVYENLLKMIEENGIFQAPLGIINPYRIIAKCAAWLHDVFEDNPELHLSTEKLEEILGLKSNEHTIIIVGLLNVLNVLTKQPDEGYLSAIKRVMSNDIAVIIKLCDLKDNLKDAKKGSRKDKYQLAQFILTEMSFTPAIVAVDPEYSVYEGQ